MKRLEYSVSIKRPATLVYDKMLGLTAKSSYEEWTSVFSPSSSYEGNWEQGSKILFTSLDDQGDKAGMVSRILENRKEEFVSIQHYGMLKSGKEITEGPEVEAWAGCLENYSIVEKDGKTIVSIEVDTVEEYEDYMNKLYPNALQKLKEICEGD